MSAVSSPVRPAEAEGRLDPELTHFVRRQMDELQVPGVAIGVADGDRVAMAGLGVTSVANPQAVDPDTLFQVGSITKTMTGTAVVALIEQGRVELDAPVRRYLPGFRVADETVSREATVRDLLTHTGGWEGDVFEDCGWGEDAIEVMVDRMAKLRQVTPHRKLWSYNNVAFSALGRILEVVHGEPYDRLMPRVLFEPLGMHGARFWAHDVLLERFAVGHAIGDRGLQIARPWAMPRSSNPVGCVVCSVRDLLRYARFHLGTLAPARPVLGDAVRACMQRPGAPEARNGDGMGLTWMLSTVGGARVVSHGGSANGQPCDLGLMPDHGMAIAVMTNCQNPGHRLAQRTIRWAQEHYLGLADPVPVPDAAAFGDLDAVVGTYETYLERRRVRRVGDELRIDFERLDDWLDGMEPRTPDRPDVPFLPIGPDTIAGTPLGDGPVGRFHRDESGAVRWLHVGHRAALRR